MANIGQPERVWEVVPDEEPTRMPQEQEEPTQVEEPEYEPAYRER